MRPRIADSGGETVCDLSTGECIPSSRDEGSDKAGESMR